MARENFSIIPTQITPFTHTTVSPIFAEEWHVRPPVYDMYVNRPRPPPASIKKVEDPRDFPYGQYLTHTNLIPSTEKQIDLFCNSRGAAIGYVNSSFTQHDIAFRENITRILKKKLQRRYRHECNDTFSPFYSF